MWNIYLFIYLLGILLLFSYSCPIIVQLVRHDFTQCLVSILTVILRWVFPRQMCQSVPFNLHSTSSAKWFFHNGESSWDENTESNVSERGTSAVWLTNRAMVNVCYRTDIKAAISEYKQTGECTHTISA